MRQQWDGYPDYWSDFEMREVIETIWENYHDKIQDLESFLNQIDDSKSVLTLPYRLKRTWLRLKWDMNTKVSPFTEQALLLEIPTLVDDNYEEVDLPFRVDTATNSVILEADDEALEPYREVDEDGRWSVKLWAPVYYVHNPITNTFFAPLLGIDILEATYAEAYGIQPWTEVYHRIVKGLWYVFTNGPTIENIRIGLFILFNIPFALRAGTVVLKTEDTGEGISVIEIETNDGTSLNDRWEFTSNFHSPFNVGDKVDAYTPLVDGGVEIVDYLNDPDWWRTLPEGTTKEKIDVIEKFCTCLIKIDGVSFFREQLLGGEVTESIPELYQTFTERILPTFVKALIILYQVWIDYVDEPSSHLSMYGELNWHQTPYRYEDGTPVKAKWIQNLNRKLHDVDPYARYDGNLLYRSSHVDERGWVVLTDGELKYDSLPESHVLYDRRRLWVPQYSFLEEVHIEDGTPTEVISRGYNWVDIDYIGDSPIHITYRDFGFPKGLENWQTTIEVFEDIYNYDPPSKKLVVPGEDIIVIDQVLVDGEPLREGVDFTFEYDRLNTGDGQIILHFANVYSKVDLFATMVPYAPHPVDENGDRIFDAIGLFFKDNLEIRGIYSSGTIHPYPSEAKYPSHILYPRT